MQLPLSVIAIVAVLVVATVLPPSSDAMLLSSHQFGPYLKLTYVHGGSDALMSHAEARGFCKALVGNQTPSFNATNSLNATTPDVGNSTAGVGNSTSEDASFYDLLSIHDPDIIPGLMKWALDLERHQFWIGGRVMKTTHSSFGAGQPHLLHMWTDGTPATFRYLSQSEMEVAEMQPDAVRCLSVDYASGRWAIHHCQDRMYFVCETVSLPPTPVEVPANSTTTSVANTTLTPNVRKRDVDAVEEVEASSTTPEPATTNTTALPEATTPEVEVEEEEAYEDIEQ